MTAPIPIAIIGAGFSGLAVAIALRQRGRSDFVIFDEANDLGGVWRDNHYPGAGCDIPSNLYSYSLAPNPNWSRLYSGSQEIHSYLKHCTQQHKVDSYIRYGMRVIGLHFSETEMLWELLFADGSSRMARVVVNATGFLQRPMIPNIPGLEKFTGPVFHSSRWPREFDHRNQRIGIIGTGASAVQIVPAIQPEVQAVTVFQRTAPWIVPKEDRALRSTTQARLRRNPWLQRLWRFKQFVRAELLAPLFLLPGLLEKRGQRIGLRFLEDSIEEPALLKKLTPDYPMGCKRILPSDTFYTAIQQSNATLQTSPIDAIGENSVRCQNGELQEFDALVLATGFDVPVAAPTIPVTGMGGRTLHKDWDQGSEAYLGTTVSGYPNLLFMMGPNTGTGNMSVLYFLESQLQYVLAYLDELGDENAVLDLLPQVQKNFNHWLQARLKKSIWSSGCRSWYQAPNGKITTMWPGLALEYRWKTGRFRPTDYRRSTV